MHVLLPKLSNCGGALLFDHSVFECFKHMVGVSIQCWFKQLPVRKKLKSAVFLCTISINSILTYNIRSVRSTLWYKAEGHFTLTVWMSGCSQLDHFSYTKKFKVIITSSVLQPVCSLFTDVSNCRKYSDRHPSVEKHVKLHSHVFKVEKTPFL